MQPEARSGRMDAVQAHPLAELLECPPATGDLLNGSAQCIDFDAGETVFRQSAPAAGSIWWFRADFCAGPSGLRRA